MAPPCVVCGGPLVPIGSHRRNGANHADWYGRNMHKQCWKALVLGRCVKKRRRDRVLPPISGKRYKKKRRVDV